MKKTIVTVFICVIFIISISTLLICSISTSITTKKDKIMIGIQNREYTINNSFEKGTTSLTNSQFQNSETIKNSILTTTRPGN